MNKENFVKFTKNTLSDMIEAHNTGDVEKMNKIFDSFENEIHRVSNLEDGLFIICNFLDSWVDDANHKYEKTYSPIKKEDWILLSLELSNALESETLVISNETILEKFGLKK